MRDALLFLPAMAALAIVVFGAMYLVIRAGDWVLRGWFGLLADGLGLPRSAAMSLAVILAALSVFGAVRWIAKRF